MKLLEKLDRKYSKFAIQNLMMYIVCANALVFVLDLLTRDSLINRLALNRADVFSGEVWRIFTFVMIPPSTSIIFIALILYFYYFIGQTLEREWGSFKFNVFYFLGILIMIVSSLLFGTIAQVSYLNLTLFLAFATLYPNYEIRVYLILPVKVKYLAYLSAGFLLLTFLTGGLSTKISIMAGLANYFIFFGKELVTGRKTRIKNVSRKKTYEKNSKSHKEHHHKCHICGRTENDDPSLDFRYCSSCDGYIEYCSDHLKNHEHIKEVQH